jgi:chitinase
VNYATGGGSAAAGTDYTTTTGTLTFAPGVTSLQINVPVLVDTLDEANETFNVNLSGASALTIADSQGVGTINDDDPLPSVSINNVTLTEGPTGTTLATFTLTLSTASGRSLSVGWITANGTATSPSDYTAASGTVTFAAGVTSQTISITIVGNAVAEPNETFVVNLRTPNNVTIGDGQGVCTILNDD